MCGAGHVFAVPFPPVPSDEELREVLRRDWTVTVLSVGFMWFIVAMATTFGLWNAVSAGVDLADPGLLVPTVAVVAFFWAIPAVATVITVRRWRESRSR